MAKSKVSAEFTQFVAKNTNKFASAKTAEKQSRGNPMPIGTYGKAVISDYTAGRAKTEPRRPYVAVEVTVLEPEEFKGQKVTGAYAQIFDSEGMSAAERLAILLDTLENMGLSRETREEYGDEIIPCLDELIDSPHYVTFTVTKGYQGRKDMECFATNEAPEGSLNKEAASNESDDSDESGSDSEELVLYMGTKHEVVARDGDNITIRNRASGKQRTVSIDDLDS